MPIIGDYNWTSALDLSTAAFNKEDDFSSYTVICKIPSSKLLAVGNVVQLSLSGPVNGATLNNVTISNTAASGHAYDADTTPTAVTFESSASVSVVAGGSYVSDPITFPFDITPKLIAFNLSTSSYLPIAYMEDILTYYLTGVQEADDTTRSSAYTVVGNTLPFVLDLQVSP
jgi:hypothetical protein